MDDATAKFVLVAICNYANEEDQAWPSHAAIARLTGLSKRTIQTSIQKLEDWGIIRRVRRDRDNGSETSAMVSVNLDISWVVKGGIATAATGVWQEMPQGVAADSTLETKDKPQGKASKPKKDQPYSEEFETEVWQPYPRKTGTSKKKAWDYWRMLTEEKQQQVKAAIPAFAALMKREGRGEDKIKWLAYFISERIYETVASPLIVPSTPSSAAKPFWETATRQEWISALQQWAMNWNWKSYWGPEPENPLRPNPPGAPKHYVPPDILDQFDVKYRGHLYSLEEMEVIKQRIALASKHPVDNDRAA
jgi:hypothetical protein